MKTTKQSLEDIEDKEAFIYEYEMLRDSMRRAKDYWPWEESEQEFKIQII